MKEVYSYYNLEETTIDFLGHAVALQHNDDYIEKPAYDTIEKMQLLACLESSCLIVPIQVVRCLTHVVRIQLCVVCAKRGIFFIKSMHF